MKKEKKIKEKELESLTGKPTPEETYKTWQEGKEEDWKCKHKWQLIIFWRDGGQVLYWECEKCGTTKSYYEWSCA